MYSVQLVQDWSCSMAKISVWVACTDSYLFLDSMESRKSSLKLIIRKLQ